MNIAFFIIFLLLGLASFGYGFVYVIKKIKTKDDDKLHKIDYLRFLIPVFVTGIFTFLSNLFLGYMQNWVYNVKEYLFLAFGSYFFAAFITYFIYAFVLYYYKPTLEVERRKYIFYSLFPSAILAIVTMFLMSEGMAMHLTYPLVEGINIGSFHIQFYGILIVSGAVLVYFICDHRFYQRFKKHGILDPIFLIAFPMGIIGARLWYCLVLEPAHYLADPVKILYIWEGGLAIQGGAIFGIIFGVIAMVTLRKYVNIRWAMDIIVPAILIAQAIGRWGNFFNHEVYGAAVEGSNWSFLPTMVYNQMGVEFSNGMISGTQIYVPLFLIECVSNLAGYFIIAYAIGQPLKKWLSLGDLTACYIIWYGLTRIIMEPMRQGWGNDGEAFAYSQSYITAFVFVGVGILLIIAFHVYDYIRKKKGKEPRNWFTA